MSVPGILWEKGYTRAYQLLCIIIYFIITRH